MDPLSMIFTAIVTGASAALKPTAEAAVKDAYAALKELIKRKWSAVAVDPIERDPKSDARQAVLKEDLEAQPDIADRQVLEQAKKVLATIEAHDSAAAQAVGITIENLRAGANANIEDVVAEGAVLIGDIDAKQDINIRTVRSVREASSLNPPKR